MKFDGKEIEERDIEKIKYLARIGDVEAQRYLAWLYENGCGVEKNLEKAKYWKELADSKEKSVFDGRYFIALFLVIAIGYMFKSCNSSPIVTSNRVINPNEYLSNITTNILEKIPEKYREDFRKGTIPPALAQKVIDSIKSNRSKAYKSLDGTEYNYNLPVIPRSPTGDISEIHLQSIKDERQEFDESSTNTYLDINKDE